MTRGSGSRDNEQLTAIPNRCGCSEPGAPMIWKGFVRDSCQWSFGAGKPFCVTNVQMGCGVQIAQAQ